MKTLHTILTRFCPCWFIAVILLITCTLNVVAAPAGDVDPSTLSGRDLYEYQMSHLSLFRLRSRRNTSMYLTSKTAGSAIGATKASKGLTQIWIAEKAGSGYTLRNANTAQYLQAEYSTPSGSRTTMYIQFSPNNTGKQSYVNISSQANFSGLSCLNLGNDGKTLYKWSYAGDSGCDWTIELVEDIAEEDIKAHFSEITGYAGELSTDKYYRIIACIYGRAITEGADLVAKDVDADNLSQYWRLEKSGSGYAIRSALTGKYIQRQTSTSVPYHVANNPIAFNIKPVQDKWEPKWTIAYGSDGAGLHAAATQGYNVVLWSTNADASVWAFQEADISEEELEAARHDLLGYEELVKNRAALQQSLDSLFADKACTALKEDIQAQSDEQLATNEVFQSLTEDMKAMVLKVKNNTWQQFTDTGSGYTAPYEHFFRVADYKIYSNYQDMAGGSNFTMSNSFGKLSGPTGIVANPGDIICIYVSASPKTYCTLQVEAVGTDGVPGDHSTGETTSLKAGLNILRYSEQKQLYIFYQLNDARRKLADYHDVTVHIEGGQLQGYWDATRGMTNADWALLRQQLLKASPVLNLKTEHLVFAMDAALVKKSEPKEMEGLMRVWDRIVANEERYMGVEDFEGRYRNVWNCFSIDYNYMFATTYGTYYNNSTLPTIMNYDNMTKVAGNLWGPSHEMGHNHQGSINVIGTTEGSNNMFSNINIFEQGIAASRRHYPADNFTQMAAGKPWLQRDIWLTTSMFFQLYLYFHAQHHDDQFLPNLFRRMRKNPIDKGTSTANVTYVNNEGQTVTGTVNVAQGSKDYLHLAKMICDVAQADLSEFFEAYGMFIPVNRMHVGDYANYLVTTTQSQINAAKAYMRKYEQKLGNIMFIDDRVSKKKADPDNLFEGVPAKDGYKIPISDEYPFASGKTYVGGDYESYTDEPADVTDDYYKLSADGKTITFYGTNYAGHKFYDQEGNFLWATNAKTIKLPAVILNLGMENVTVMTAQYDMKDVPCLDEATAISDLRADVSKHPDSIYDLGGRRISPSSTLQKGIYIIGGKLRAK